ncbi:hydrogenase maturation protease [Phytoactinopolyspora limicola]|uniref:hydrogenase maturation protease n=1 Tax=Phytoactinopolyspora limicola TaxID=2715536 RepID=UPI00140D88DF|nr:hydrogenase maturation protease [Phytoactinopolyspora limicola]
MYPAQTAPATPTRQVVVIGVGNQLRHDDGVGPTVIRMLQRRSLPHVTLAIADDEPDQLVELWSGGDPVIVIAAVQNGSSCPGTLRQIIVDRPAAEDDAWSSTPGLGTNPVVEQALARGPMPRRLVVFAVDGADFSAGPGLTAAVAAAVDRLLRCVLSEIERAGSHPPSPLGTSR